MACDQLEFQGKEYTREEFKQAVRDGHIVIPGLVSHEIDTAREFKHMPFKFSADKIHAGAKFITVRPQKYNMGTYKDGKNMFNVFPEGKQTLSQYLSKTGLTKEKFVRDFLGDEKTKYEHVRQFLDDGKPMEIYRIEKVTSNDDIIPEISDQRYAKIYENRQAIFKRIKSQMKDEKDPLKHEELRARKDLIAQEMASLKSDESRTFGMLREMMKSDLAMASKILDTKKDKRSLDFAKSLTANYGTMLMDYFEDVYRELPEADKIDMQEFMDDAKKLAQRISMQEFSLANEQQMRLTGKDVLKVDGLPIDTKDINLASAWAYDTRFNNNPLVQSITKTIRDAQLAINARMVEFRHVNNELVKNLRKAGYNYDFMIQTDEKGNKTHYLVNKLSNEYRELANKANESVQEKMTFYAQNHDFIINQKAQDVRDARIRQYFLDNNSIVHNENDIKTYEQQVAEYAERMVDTKNPYTFKAIMDKMAIRPNRITQAEREFFVNYLQYNGMWAEKVGDEWINPLDMQAHNRWEDPKWREIQNMPTTDPRRAFYDHVEKHLKQGHRMRRDESNYLPWNYIPEKYKPLGILSKVQQFMHDHLAQRLSVNRDTINPETGEVEKKIPLYMHNNSLSPENRSYDLGNVLEDYMKETWNYDEKKKVEEPVKMMLSLLKAQRVYETNPDGSIKMANGEEQFKNGLSNNYIQASHRVAATIYGETQDQELVTGKKFFTASEQANMKMIKDDIARLNLTPQEKEIALQYTSLRVEYVGDNEAIAKYVELATKYQHIYDNAKNFTGSKAMNSLMFLSSVTYLGINMFAGMGEILQGYSQLFTESAGGRYFNDAQATRAMGYALSNLTPWNHSKKSHFGDIATFFDSMGDIFHESEGRLKSKMESIAFAQYKAANYMTNTCFTVAMLMHDTIKDVDGREHTLFDSLSFHGGKATWTKNISQELYEEDGKPSQFLLGLMHKSDEIMVYNRERKTFMDPIKLDAKTIGRMLGQFKKNWMIANFYYRFGSPKESNLTGGLDNEGFYNTFWKNIIKSPKVADPVTGEMVDAPGLASALGAPGRMLKYLFKFSTIGKKLGFGPKPGEYSEMVEANLRKFMREFSLAMTITTSMLVLQSMSGGGEDDWARMYVINQLARLQRDVMQFMDPVEFGSIIKNPMPVLSTVTDWYSLMSGTAKMGLLGDPHGNMGSHFIKGLGNQVPYVRQAPALYRKFHKAVVYGIQ